MKQVLERLNNSTCEPNIIPTPEPSSETFNKALESHKTIDINDHILNPAKIDKCDDPEVIEIKKKLKTKKAG